MSKRILITGIDGFVGHHTFEHIMKNTDWTVVGVDSLTKEHKGDSLRLSQVLEVHPEWRARLVKHRINLSGHISHRVADVVGEVDYVLNIASRSHVDDSITDPVPFVTDNVALALAMGEYARITKPKKFIQCSTDEVFGPAIGEEQHTEWLPFKPSNPYAASKASQNAILYSYWRTYEVPLMITHCMNMFGERQDPEKYIPMCIAKIQRGEELTIHGKEGDIGSRMYLHCRNLADAWLYMLREINPVMYEDDHTKHQEPLAMNIAGQVEMDNLELADLIAAHLGKELKYKLVDFHSARPGHDRRYALDSTKIRQAGWSESLSFEETIEKTIQWTVEHPEWML